MSFLSGNAPQISTPTAFQPTGFTSPGISASYAGGAGGGNVNVAQSGGLSSLIGGVQLTFGNESKAFSNLAGTVQPGFSQFRKAGLADLTNQQNASVSNLQDNLAQRRIMGSSFANAQQTQRDAQFAQARDQFIAQSYLQELQASNQLTQEKFQAATSKFTAGINEFNLEAGIAADLTAKVTASMTSIAEAQAQLDAQAAQGVGSFIGMLSSAAIGAYGSSNTVKTYGPLSPIGLSNPGEFGFTG